MIETSGKVFDAKKLEDGVLRSDFGEDFVVFYEDRIEIKAKSMLLYKNSVRADATISDSDITFTYKGSNYALHLDGGKLSYDGDNIIFTADGDVMTLSFKRN